MIKYRPPIASDGAAMWSLTQSTGVLDLNSPYAYMLIGEHFAATSALAIADERVAGFVSAYIPPQKPNTLFVWQIGVDSDFRGQGIALGLLDYLLDSDACANIQHIETTITPDNIASRKLFERLATNRHIAITESPDYFSADYFPGEGHLAESLFRLGPLPL